MGPRVLGSGCGADKFRGQCRTSFYAMVEGSQTVLKTAWILMFFVLGVIAQSIGTAVFPTLSALVAEDNMPGYKDHLARVMRSLLFLAFPACVGLIVVGVPLIGTLFERGEWTLTATNGAAWALAFFALGIAGHSLLEALSRAFYALEDTWTPVKIGIAAMVSNIILSVIFIQFMGDEGNLGRGPFAGLALANSLTTLIEAAVLWRILSQRIGGIHDRYVLNNAVRALVAALLMGAIVYGIDTQISQQHYIVRLLVAGGVGVVAYFSLALLMGLEELTGLIRRFRS